MSFLQRMMGHTLQAEASPVDDIWYGVAGTATHAGIHVTPEISLQVSTVFACRKVISETLACLPLLVYERLSDRDRRRATDDPVYRLLHKRPNGWQTPFEFKELMTGWAALYGKAIARKHWNALQTDVEWLEPIHPDLVRIEVVNGERRYQIRGRDGLERPFVQGEILHIPGPSLDGIEGVSISRIARETIALARAMESFGARYFQNDTTVGLVLEYPGKLSEQAHQRLKDSLAADGGWLNAHKAKVLEEGMKLSRTLGVAKDAQLIEARGAQVVEICRFFRMPPHKVQHLLNATFSNIEHQGIEFATDTMTPWAVRWEQAVTRDLIEDDEKFFAEFVMAALLRGDSAARSTYYRERFYIGSLSRNEIRALENEGPVPGGDTYYIQGATVPLDSDGKPVAVAPEPTSAGASKPEPDEPDERPRRAPSVAPPTKAPVRAPTRPKANAVFSALVSDAAERIARAETRELEKRADHAIQDHARFSAWVDAFYDGHLAYVTKTLQPLVEGWSTMTGETLDIPLLALRVRDHGRAAALSAEFCQAPKQVIEHHAESVREILASTFHWDD